jgi:hypothetical protein
MELFGGVHKSFRARWHIKSCCVLVRPPIEPNKIAFASLFYCACVAESRLIRNATSAKRFSGDSCEITGKTAKSHFNDSTCKCNGSVSTAQQPEWPHRTSSQLSCQSEIAFKFDKAAASRAHCSFEHRFATSCEWTQKKT